uniref:DNA primase large subunit (Trinotate prediction) n=1 Tax=Henneguya salminicola TaxID=69463 RepID=A0A6G3MGJ7_HENSL
MNKIEEDDRLMVQLQNISQYQESTSFDYKNATFEKINLNSIDKISEESFPPCMQCAHAQLKRNGHLKYHGRIQYGLFLKGIGFSLEESLTFWRNCFNKTIESEKFDKLYSYYIRYNYGQEGKRVDFHPYNCMKIIMSDPPVAGDSHGCPFKQFDQKNLESMLRTKGITNIDQNEIIELSKNQHYQIACARFYEIVHNQPKQTISISHPNEYFQFSRSLIENKK